jgi:hypothetical protein
MQEMRLKAFSGQEPSAKDVKELAEKMKPLYREAVDIIVKENEKFAEVLTDKQKEIHKADLDRMKRDVDRTMERLDRWKEGNYKPGEFVRQKKHRKGKGKELPKKEPEEQYSPTSFNFWELYVKTFIEAFGLDEGQQTLAYSVLADMKKVAEAYRKDHSQEFGELIAKIEAIKKMNTTKPDANTEELASLQKKLEEANKPILDMFDELKERLMAIPTEAQQNDAEAILSEKKAQREKTETKKKPSSRKAGKSRSQ